MSDRRVVVVIAKPVGRLANRLVLFSHFIGAAIEHDLTIVNPAFGHYANLFPATARDLLCRFPPGRALPAPPGGRMALLSTARTSAEILHRLQRAGRDVGVIRLARRERLDLNGEAFLGMIARHRIVVVEDWWFRNPDNCERHRDAICSFFTPDEQTLRRARGPVEQAKALGRYVVGVHVRRGDYRSFRGGRFFYSHAQYRSVMRALREDLDGRSVTFFVCSDEPVPPDAFSDLEVMIGGGHPLEDLFGLAACDLLIGPPSTYSQWASFYGTIPLHRISNPDERPSLESFRPSRGLGRGSGERAWTDPTAFRSRSPGSRERR